ncbi:unnamed protein product [Alternaria alternata]
MPYLQTKEAQDGSSAAATSPGPARRPIPGDIDSQLRNNSPELLFDSPSTVINSLPSPNSAPLAYYDLLAEDAINNIDKYNLNVDLDRNNLSRQSSPVADTPGSGPQLHSSQQALEAESSAHEQWNSTNPIPMSDDELVLFQHYIAVIGPILDLNDPSRQFTETVPSLAVHNVGLMKSLLAVSARHMALLNEPQICRLNIQDPSPDGDDGRMRNLQSPLLQAGTQYYYETLQYLSKNLFYPSYNRSREIISTSILISTYEMWDSEGQYSNGAWERHCVVYSGYRGAKTTTESPKTYFGELPRWQWIRQDTWVAFREGRRVLTIWRPTKRLMDLSPDELALRIVYICGRCVDFAANEKKYDLNTRIDQAGKLLQALEDWHRALPVSFHPIHRGPPPGPGAMFAPIWIHPPSYAAAVQTFHFARIIVLINQPSMGGVDEFRIRQRSLDESVDMICGIAMAHQGRGNSSASGELQVHLCCYNVEQLTALVRAAQSKRSPLIIQLFPSTLKRSPLLAHAAAHAVKTATVPLSLHIDHAQNAEHIREIIATLPVDLVMVDMSYYDEAENLEKTRILTMECGEDSIADTGDLEALFTSPEDVDNFINAGIDILAPSIGNVHGDYGPAGPKEGQLHYDRLEAVDRQITKRVLVVLHGTNDFPAEVMQRCIRSGAIKLNVNKLSFEVGNEVLRKHAPTTSLAKLIDMQIEVIQKETERWMDICSSSGKA